TDQAFDRQRDDGGRQLALGRGCSLEVSTSRSACQRSWAVCMRSHDAAEVSNTAPSRTAIAGVTGCLSARMSYSVCRDTPSAAAISTLLTVIPGSTISRRNPPGCVGHRSALRFGDATIALAP